MLHGVRSLGKALVVGIINVRVYGQNDNRISWIGVLLPQHVRAREHDSGCRIATRGLNGQGKASLHLLGDHAGLLGAGCDGHVRVGDIVAHLRERALDHRYVLARAVAQNLQELLGPDTVGKRPQPRTRTTRQHDKVRQRSILSKMTEPQNTIQYVQLSSTEMQVDRAMLERAQSHDAISTKRSHGPMSRPIGGHPDAFVGFSQKRRLPIRSGLEHLVVEIERLACRPVP